MFFGPTTERPIYVYNGLHINIKCGQYNHYHVNIVKQEGVLSPILYHIDLMLNINKWQRKRMHK